MPLARSWPSSWLRLSPLSGAIMKDHQLTQHRRVMLGRNGLIADNPRIEFGIGHFDQVLELIELGGIQFIDASVGEAADNQIHLAHAAAPGAEQQPPPSLVQSCAGSFRHECRSHFFWSMIFSENRLPLFRIMLNA
jgi:hypothetical protein